MNKIISLADNLDKENKEKEELTNDKEQEIVKQFFSQKEIEEMGTNADFILSKIASDPNIKVGL